MKCFKIKKGKHYNSGFHFGLVLGNTLKFKCKFDKSCLYKIDGVDAYDINKLYGFSTSWFHHRQSARFGWRCLNGKTIQLLTYTYNNSERVIEDSKVIAEVKPNREFYCEIIKYDNYFRYVFINYGKPISHIDIPRKKTIFPFKYVLYPYFGGNLTAPHDMKIFIERI